jgi:DNA-binding MarR family transcriptional regulator
VDKLALKDHFAEDRPLPESTRSRLVHGLQELVSELMPPAQVPANIEAGQIDDLLRARARRSKFFNPRLFADPAWDMLLELYAAELAERRVSVSSLCLASGVPATTALRWLTAMQKEKLVVRENDPLDGRRIFVKLSATGIEKLTSYFESLPPAVRPL